jgi:hypothetical protein
MVAEVHPLDLANHVHGDHLFALLKYSAGQLSTLVNFGSADSGLDGQFSVGANMPVVHRLLTTAPHLRAAERPFGWGGGSISIRTDGHQRPCRQRRKPRQELLRARVAEAQGLFLNGWLPTSAASPVRSALPRSIPTEDIRALREVMPQFIDYLK